MALIARTYADPQDGDIIMLCIELRTGKGAVSVEREGRRVALPTMDGFDAVLAGLGYERVTPWRLEGDGWEAEVVVLLLNPKDAGSY